MNLVIKWCFNNNVIKALCMDKWGHTFKAFIIIIKKPFYVSKINKRTNKKISSRKQFSNALSLT